MNDEYLPPSPEVEYVMGCDVADPDSEPVVGIVEPGKPTYFWESTVSPMTWWPASWSAKNVTPKKLNK